MSNHEYPGDHAAGKLDVAEMNKMISFYANHIAPVLTELKKTQFPDVDPAIPDATSAWMSFAEIEKFISDNKASGNANGVRIYYGVHTSDSFPGDATKNQKGSHNIIFVPTTSGSEPPTYKNSVNMVEVNLSDNAPDNATNDTGYALDHSALCPPYCQIA